MKEGKRCFIAVGEVDEYCKNGLFDFIPNDGLSKINGDKLTLASAMIEGFVKTFNRKDLLELTEEEYEHGIDLYYAVGEDMLTPWDAEAMIAEIIENARARG